MHESPERPQSPVVSIILPTYNRARFLPQALESIRAQTYTNWELIVVDDGSTDNTPDLVTSLCAGMGQPYRYVRQDNQGAYGARNTGLDWVCGNFIAFFDSDDIWLPHHLQDCLATLEACPELDWVFAGCRMVEMSTNKTIMPNTMYRPTVRGSIPGIQRLTHKSDRLWVVDDNQHVTRLLLGEGPPGGLQNSVVRAKVFETMRFNAAFRNEAEDRLVLIRCLKRGCRLGYLDAVHVLYRVHDDQSSGAAVGGAIDKRLSVQRGVIRGYESLAREVQLTPTEAQSLRQRLGREYFWLLGYSLFWLHGRHQDALNAFSTGIKYWPWEWRYWKTYAIAWVRSRMQLLRPRPTPNSCEVVGQ